jgi:hypothetical protein
MNNFLHVMSATIAMLLLVGCNTVKIGNFGFKASDVCSQEFSSEYLPFENCLPPDRA